MKKITYITIFLFLCNYFSTAQTMNEYGMNLPYISFLDTMTIPIDSLGGSIVLNIAASNEVFENTTFYKAELNSSISQQGLANIITVSKLLTLHLIIPDGCTGIPDYKCGSIFFSIKPNTDGNTRDIAITDPYGVTIHIIQSDTVRNIINPPDTTIYEPDTIKFDIPGNWILTRTYTDDSAHYNEDITFMDGLGYPEQIIQVQASPKGKNIVTPVVYDNMRRDDAKSYLPYVSYRTTPVRETQPLTQQYQYYLNKFDADDAAHAYIEKKYESSVLNRVQKEYNAGKAFCRICISTIGSLASKNNKYKTFDYLTNSPNEVFMMNVKKTTSALTIFGYYPQGALYKNVVNSEDGQTVISFTDKDGNVVLQRAITESDSIDTYYAYDDYGQRRWVISPEGSALLTANMMLLRTDATAKKYCYVYTYDGLGRQITKQLPGKDTEYMVYDRRNRPVMSRDGRLQTAGKWILYKYDNLDRMTHQYLITDSRNQSVLQSLFDNAVNNDASPNAIYNIANKQLLVETRYDSYSQNPPLLAFVPINAINQNVYDVRITGLKTYEKVAVLDDVIHYVERAFYYDYLGRLIQTAEKNHLGHRSRYSTKYDFVGNALAQHESHETYRLAEDVKYTEYTYDHRGRLLTEATTVNGSDTAKVKYRYNELGQQITKIYDNNLVVDSTKYNIQGWITEQHARKTDFPKTPLFLSKLRYYDPTVQNVTPSYAGNITEWTWQHYDSKPNMRVFTYDKLNRLTGGINGVNGINGINSNNAVKADFDTLLLPFTEQKITYDRNGNMLTLRRYGNTAQTWDDFTCSYNGNLLTNIAGAYTASYTYDANGNMNYDGRRNINLEYNLLNLPYRIMQNSQTKATYRYIADGTKAGAVDSAGKGFDYLGTFVYTNENNVRTLESINFGGGRINKTNNAYDINYFITDHLGSTRVIVNSNGEIIEQKDFYPFGKEHENPNLITSTNRWGFSGKEKQTIRNLGYLDFGARMLDSEIGRWFVQDPLQEERPWISSYAYCSNNPVGRTDPNGLLDDVVITGSLAQTAFDELHKYVSNELTLSMDKTGNVTYTQNNPNVALSSDAQQLTNAIDDHTVTVNVKAENTAQTSTGNLYIGGAFMGNEVTQVFPGFEGNTSSNSVNIVNANQEVNPKVLGKMSSVNLYPGADMLHEVTEAYQGAKISQSTGISSPMGGQAGSVYRQAHNAATSQTNIYQSVYNSKGEEIYNPYIGATKIIYSASPYLRPIYSSKPQQITNILIVNLNNK